MIDQLPTTPLPATTEEATRWWGRRRLRFNATLFAVGVVSFIGTLVMMDWTPRGPDEDPGDFLGMCCAVPVYAVMANVGYTAGAFVEWRWPVVDLAAAQRRREKLYRRGVLFSCALTALPFLLSAVACLVSRLRL